MVPWTKKYLPSSSKDIVGQEEAVTTLRNFVQNFKKHRNNAVIIYGPTGTGKTAAAYAVAREFDLELLEINASDFRNKDHINSIVGNASKQLSLFFKGKVILVDEVDGLSGMQDRGGIQALTDLIDTTSFPIICTCTDPFDKKFANLRKKALLIEFKPLGYETVLAMLKGICNKEKIRHSEDDLKMLARISAGDARAAINDLQLLTAGKDGKELRKEDLELLGERLKTDSIENALLKVFKTTKADIAARAFDNITEDLNEVALWIDENLPYEYKKPEELARAYDCLSKADIFNRRIKRWQHWRFLVYINALLSVGIATSKDEKNKDVIKYKRTGRLLKIYISNMKYMKRKAIAEKIAEKTHASTKRVIKDVMPYIQFIARKNKSYAKQLGEDLELEEEELEWLSR